MRRDEAAVCDQGAVLIMVCHLRVGRGAEGGQEENWHVVGG